MYMYTLFINFLYIYIYNAYIYKLILLLLLTKPSIISCSGNVVTIIIKRKEKKLCGLFDFKGKNNKDDEIFGLHSNNTFHRYNNKVFVKNYFDK